MFANRFTDGAIGNECTVDINFLREQPLGQVQLLKKVVLFDCTKIAVHVQDRVYTVLLPCACEGLLLLGGLKLQ